MYYCDHTEKVVEWSSEEIAIPYRSPKDNRYHLYFPDFYMKVRNTNGSIQSYLVEVKPKAQVEGPKPQAKKTKRYLTEVATYAINQAKWEAAREWCADRRLEFLILTEEHLNV